MPSYRTELLNRLVAMEKEALDSWVSTQFPGKAGIDAKPYLFHQQSFFPYIVHRVGTSVPDPKDEDNSLRSYEVFIRIVMCNLTSGVNGENELWVNEMIPILEQYFIEHPMLTTDSTEPYTDEPLWLYSEAVIINDTSGIIPFEIGGIDAVQIGEELSLDVPIIRFIDL